MAGPFLADVARPRIDLVRRWIGVVRLHRGDDPEPAEARDVGPRDGLDVLDAVPSIADRVGGRGSLVQIEDHPDPAVADGVDLHLPATAIRLGHERIQLVRLPFRQAGGGVVLVGREHERGPGLDDAVRETLEDPGIQPLAAAQVTDLGFVLVQSLSTMPPRSGRVASGARGACGGAGRRSPAASARARVRPARSRHPGSR